MSDDEQRRAMSLRRSLAATADALTPGQLLVAAAVAVLQAGGLVTGRILGRALLPFWGGPIGTLVALFVVAPLAVAVYAPVLADGEDTADGEEEVNGDGISDIARTAARAVGDRYVPVLVATVVAGLVVVGVGLAAALFWLAADTVVQFVRYATADPSPPSAIAQAQLAGLAGALGALGAGVVVRFADVLAFDRERRVDARRAWRRSVRFCRLEPVALLGYVAVVLGVGLAASAAGAVLGPAAGGLAGPGSGSPGQGSPAAIVARLAAVLGSTAVIAAVGGTLHAAFYRETVAPALDDSADASVEEDSTEGPATGWIGVPELPTGRARAVVLALLLLATVLGTGAVRVTDPAVGSDGMAPLPDDPVAAYETAAANTAGTSHRYEVQRRNLSAGGPFRTTTRAAIDYDDRELSVFIYGEDDLTVGGYFAEGTFATHQSNRGREWVVRPLPGFGVSSGDPGTKLPDASANWSVERRNASAIVLGLDRPDAVASVLDEGYLGSYDGLVEESWLRVVIDRDRAVVDSVQFRLHSRETGHAYRYRIRYSEVGTADVRRPPVIDGRGPIEWFWDALYY